MAETSNEEDQHAVKYSEEAKNWFAYVDEELKNVKNMAQGSTETSKWKEMAIFRVPAYVKNRNPTAYSPRVVSMGPYHHGEIHLMPMEEHKERALLYYLSRSGKPLQVLYESLYKEVKALKDTYDQLDDVWAENETKFLESMILDGCFMLQIFLAPNIVFPYYGINDPIFGYRGLLINSPYFKRDMLMLENQLPMRVLEILCAECYDYRGNVDGLHHDILKFFFGNFGFEEFRSTIRSLKFLHVLDFHRHYLVFRCSPNSEGGMIRLRVPQFEGLISSAARLNEAGIQFKGLNEVGLGFGSGRIRFENGVLELPVINLEDGTESMFLNMTAFERLYTRTGLTDMDVTSFILFMDNLIDNERDVAVLRSKGIVQTITGSDQAVAELFNSLSKDLILRHDNRIYEVRYEINEYCKKRWNEWRANLCHTYFRNPWVTLSVIAAFLLFTLAILQTAYTILPYYRE